MMSTSEGSYFTFVRVYQSLILGCIAAVCLTACSALSTASTTSATLPVTPAVEDNEKLLIIGENQVSVLDLETGSSSTLPFGYLHWPGIDLSSGRGISTDGWLAARVLGPNGEEDQLSLQLVNAFTGETCPPIRLLSEALVSTQPENVVQDLIGEDVGHMLFGGWGAPRWSPDGRNLAFMAARDGASSDLYLYRLEDGSVQRLTNERDQANAIGWSPDSSTIIYTVAMDFTSLSYLSRSLRSYNILTGDDLPLMTTQVWNGGHIFGWHSNHEFLFGVHGYDLAPYRDVYLVDISAGKADLLFEGFVEAAAVEPYSRAYALLLDDDLGWGSGAFIGSLETGQLEAVVDWGLGQKWYDLTWLDSENRYAVASSAGSLMFDTELKQLDAYPEEVCPPVPSPDGAWILFGGCEGTAQSTPLRLYERWDTAFQTISGDDIQRQFWRLNSEEVIFLTLQGEVYAQSIPSGKSKLLVSERALEIEIIQPQSARVTALATQRAAPTLTPKPTSTPTATSTLGPTLTPEIPENAPRLEPGAPFFFDKLFMVNASVGWAVTARTTDYDFLRTYHLLRTEDGGQTWREVTPPELFRPSDVMHLKLQGYFLDGQQAWLMFDGGFRSMVVWRTEDGGQIWRSSRINYRGQSGEAWPILFFNNSEQGWLLLSYFQGAGSYEEDILRTYDGGQTWESILLEDYELGPIRDFSAVNSNTAWITSGHGAGVTPAYEIHLTNDGGLTWEHVIPDPQDYSGPLQGDCVLHQPRLESYSRGRVLRSCYTYDDPPYRYFLGFTEDGGRSWRYQELPGIPFSLGDQRGWAVKAMGGGSSIIYQTRDGGTTWTELSMVEWEGPLAFVDASHGWAIAEGKLLKSEDGGRTWIWLDAELVEAPDLPVDLTRTISRPSDLIAIQSQNANQIELVAEFRAQSPTSLAISDRALYTGLASGRVLRWPWKATVISPDSIPQLRISDSWIYDLDVPKDGLGFVAASQDGRAYGYRDIFYDFLEIIPGAEGEISGVAALANGVLTAGEDGVVRQWGWAPGQGRYWQVDQTMKGHQGWVWDVDASPGEAIFASGGGDTTIRLWKAEDGTPLGVLRGHSSAVTKVRFSPEGKLLASCSRDGTVRIWNAGSVEQAYRMEGHQDWVLDLNYSQDGSLLASVDASGTLILWDAATGELLQRLKAHSGAARGVVFSPDGLMLITAGDDDTVRLWGIDT